MKYLKFYETKKYNPELIKKLYKDFLSDSEMVNFILDNNLRDSYGIIDYNDAKEIAYSSENGYNLTLVKLSDICNWIFDNPYKTKINIPAIIIKDDENYEVLDGKTRLGYLNYIGVDYVYVYLGFK